MTRQLTLGCCSSEARRRWRGLSSDADADVEAGVLGTMVVYQSSIILKRLEAALAAHEDDTPTPSRQGSPIIIIQSLGSWSGPKAEKCGVERARGSSLAWLELPIDDARRSVWPMANETLTSISFPSLLVSPLLNDKDSARTANLFPTCYPRRASPSLRPCRPPEQLRPELRCIRETTPESYQPRLTPLNDSNALFAH